MRRRWWQHIPEGGGNNCDAGEGEGVNDKEKERERAERVKEMGGEGRKRIENCHK